MLSVLKGGVLNLHVAHLMIIVLLLGIFRRAPCHATTRGHHCALLLPRGRPAPKIKQNKTFFIDGNLLYQLHQGAIQSVLNVLKLKKKHLIGPKRSEILKVFPYYDTNCPFLGQNCSLPFSLRSLDIPALLKSWQKH
jgi:hypothetical protein